MDTLFIGQNLIYLNETASTNTYAIDLLNGLRVAEGSIVLTDRQTMGKGQRGNTWLSEPSMNLTFSLILYPVFLNAANCFYLSKCVALALHDALAEILPSGQHDIKIKWPNDILVNNKKIAGVLIENNFRTDTVQYSVAGIGLNVNQEYFGQLDVRINSLKKLCKQHFELREVLNTVCRFAEVWYLKLRKKDFDSLNNAYTSKLYLLNEWSVFKRADGHPFNACIRGVNEHGELVMELENAKTKTFEVKELIFPSRYEA